MFHNIIEGVECVFDKSRSHVDFYAVASVADGDATTLVFEQSKLRASGCRSTRSTLSDTGHKALCPSETPARPRVTCTWSIPLYCTVGPSSILRVQHSSRVQLYHELYGCILDTVLDLCIDLGTIRIDLHCRIRILVLLSKICVDLHSTVRYAEVKVLIGTVLARYCTVLSIIIVHRVQ